MYNMFSDLICQTKYSMFIPKLLSNALFSFQNYGAFYELVGAGVTGPVTLKGLKNGTSLDLSSNKWTYQVRLLQHLSYSVSSNPIVKGLYSHILLSS